MIAHQAFRALNTMSGLAPLKAPVFAGADPVLPSPFRAGAAAAAALGLLGSAAEGLLRLRGGLTQEVSVDLGHAAASLAGFAVLRKDGAPVPRPAEENPTVGFYRAGCGRMIHLHGGFPHLAERTLDLLNARGDRRSIAESVAKWDAFALEDALAYLGLCGAVVRSAAEWAGSPQGVAIKDEGPLVLRRIGEAPRLELAAGDSPLAGVRVLDLTRVLAGPAAGRMLAGLGADVLAIRAPQLPSIAVFDLENGLGKRAAYLDLTRPAESGQLRLLAQQAHIFVDSYRPGALGRLGFSAEALADLAPGIIHVAVDCYGHRGPWARRPGWEQLAQSATGLAMAQGEFLARRSGRAPAPALLGVAACDYITGYLAAAGAVAALLRRAREGGSWQVEVSLATTAQWLLALGREPDPLVPERFDAAALTAGRMMTVESPHGTLELLRPPLTLSQTPMAFSRPPFVAGADRAEWLQACSRASPVA